MMRVCFGLLLASSLGAAAFFLLRSRGFDCDELEHLHAACAVSWGQVPYRDFFEHHGPALYYLLQPVLWLTGAEPSALWGSRALMAALSAATLGLIAATAFRLSGRAAAVLAPVLLACTTIFFGKAVEIRPDVPSMALLAAAAFVVASPPTRRAPLAWLGVGVLLGLATLFTQKAVVPAVALAVAQSVDACLRATNRRKGIRALHPIAWIAAGGAAAWCAAALLFSTAGAAADFFDATVVRLWRWPVRHDPLEALRPTLAADLPLWLGAAAGVATAFRYPRQAIRPIALTVALCFLGGLLVKAAYAQYYLLWFPLAAVVAAHALVGWTRATWSRPMRRIVAGTAVALAVGESILLVLAIRRGADGACPHLFERFSTVGVAAAAAVVPAALAGAAIFCAARNHRTCAMGLLVALGFGYAALRNLDTLCWSNAPQREAIARVNRLVGPGETVLDGFTGYGVFRRHAYYYWWLNPYSLALMTPAEREGELLECLQRSPPKVVCMDENVRRLPEPIVAWIERHYADGEYGIRPRIARSVPQDSSLRSD